MPTSTNKHGRTLAGGESADSITCSYFPEAFLLFGDDGLHVDPKAGIARYGPRSYSCKTAPVTRPCRNCWDR
jgi:hypothetical protein